MVKYTNNCLYLFSVDILFKTKIYRSPHGCEWPRTKLYMSNGVLRVGNDHRLEFLQYFQRNLVDILKITFEVLELKEFNYERENSKRD